MFVRHNIRFKFNATICDVTRDFSSQLGNLTEWTSGFRIQQRKPTKPLEFNKEKHEIFFPYFYIFHKFITF